MFDIEATVTAAITTWIPSGLPNKAFKQWATIFNGDRGRACWRRGLKDMLENPGIKDARERAVRYSYT